MPFAKSLVLTALAAAVCTSAALAADINTDYKPKVAANEMKRIEAAMPTQPYVKPAKPRKILVYVESKGYYHDSIPVCAFALKMMGEKTGAFQADLTDDDVNTWSLENLNKYDGIFMDNCVGDHPKTAEGKKDFIEYIKSGHGLMGCHAGADCNHNWPDYFDMIGGEFGGHPWGKASIKNEDPKNPVNQMFDGKGFVTSEEIYTFKMTNDKRAQGYGRDKLHILLSVDMENSHYKDTTRKDMDYGISWIQEYGKGKVFYTAIGHNRSHFWHPIVLQHYLAGIQYALGDLKADATPTAKMNPAPTVGPGPDIKSPTFDPK